MQVGIFLLVNRHLRVTRSLANLKASTKLPVTEHVSETQQGLPTIRAYGKGARFEHRFNSLVDDYSKVCV